MKTVRANKHNYQARLLKAMPLLTLMLILFISVSPCLAFSASDDPVADAAMVSEIRRVSFAKRSDGNGLVIRLHATSAVNAYSEPRIVDSNQIEVIIFNAQLTKSYRSDTPADPVKEFSVEPRDGHLVFMFALDQEITVEAAAYPDQASSDLLIGITTLKDSRQAAIADNGTALPEVQPVVTADAGTSDVKEPVKNAADQPRKVVPKKTSPASVPVINASTKVPANVRPTIDPTLQASAVAERWTLDTIVIDAGHGGHDPGASYFGINEKDVNLAVALKLGYYLERFLKVKVVYTRTEDVFVDLEDRGHIANQHGGKLFISIHSNSAPYSKSVRGTETYILGLHRSERAREVMERENNVIQLEDNPDQYNDFYQNNITRTLALSANLKMSEKLAASIENQFAERARRNSRGVKQAGLIVLWAASMPAVLVELGYLTNRFEAAYLNGEQGQDYLASAIYRAVRDFKLDYEKGLEAQNKRVSILETEN